MTKNKDDSHSRSGLQISNVVITLLLLLLLLLLAEGGGGEEVAPRWLVVCASSPPRGGAVCSIGILFKMKRKSRGVNKQAW